MMQLPKCLRTGLLSLLFLAVGYVSVQAQESSLIRKRTTLFIPKIDVFWSGAVISEGFPTFFPLELEINFPARHVALEFIVTPWYERFRTQFTLNTSVNLIGGVGLRYYFQGTKPTDAATGFFVEPQIFYRYYSQTTDNELTATTTTSTEVDYALMAAGGYQHLFFDKLYVQGRLSVGYTNTRILQPFRSGEIAILPWIGVGFRL